MDRPTKRLGGPNFLLLLTRGDRASFYSCAVSTPESPAIFQRRSSAATVITTPRSRSEDGSVSKEAVPPLCVAMLCALAQNGAANVIAAKRADFLANLCKVDMAFFLLSQGAQKLSTSLYCRTGNEQPECQL